MADKKAISEILKQGVATPFIIFHFAAGDIELSINNKTQPRYFVSLKHVRSCDVACNFTLNLKYVPDTFEEGKPDTLVNILLKSVKQQVSYEYGYCTPDGQLHLQDKSYTGKFYSYKEVISPNDGSISYEITGVGSSVDLSTETITVGHDAIKYPRKPSNIILGIIRTNNITKEFFKDYSYVVDDSDTPVMIPTFKNMTVTDIIFGEVNGEGTRQGGLVSYGIKYDGAVTAVDAKNALDLGKITNEEYHAFLGSQNALNNGGNLGGYAEYWENIRTEIKEKIGIPYKAYFDDTITDSSKPKGTFYYIPVKYNENTDGKVYMYELGNNSRDSDVLSFSVTYDGGFAIAATSLDEVHTNIDVDGNNTGSSNIMSKLTDGILNLPTAINDFKKEVNLSKSMLSNKLSYPFTATLEILGQLECTNLLDIVYIVVMINGTEHPVLSGKYTVTAIEDNISMSGFTTTLTLAKYAPENESAYNTYVSNNPKGKAAKTQEVLDSAQTITTDNQNTTTDNQNE